MRVKPARGEHLTIADSHCQGGCLFDNDWWRLRLGEPVQCLAGPFGPDALRRLPLGLLRWPVAANLLAHVSRLGRVQEGLLGRSEFPVHGFRGSANLNVEDLLWLWRSSGCRPLAKLVRLLATDMAGQARQAQTSTEPGRPSTSWAP